MQFRTVLQLCPAETSMEEKVILEDSLRPIICCITSIEYLLATTVGIFDHRSRTRNSPRSSVRRSAGLGAPSSSSNISLRSPWHPNSNFSTHSVKHLHSTPPHKHLQLPILSISHISHERSTPRMSIQTLSRPPHHQQVDNRIDLEPLHLPTLVVHRAECKLQTRMAGLTGWLWRSP